MSTFLTSVLHLEREFSSGNFIKPDKEWVNILNRKISVPESFHKYILT